MSHFNPRRLWRIVGIVLAILVIPLIAMQFSSQIDRTLFDFVILGTMLLGAGLTYELLLTKGASTRYKYGVGLAVATSLILVWMNGAVGVIGSEDNPVNMMYIGVLVVGIVGVILARFQARGMGYAAFAMALAQMLVPTVAMIRNNVPMSPWVMGVFVLNAGFAALFIWAGFLLHTAQNR